MIDNTSDSPTDGEEVGNDLQGLYTSVNEGAKVTSLAKSEKSDYEDEEDEKEEFETDQEAKEDKESDENRDGEISFTLSALNDLYELDLDLDATKGLSKEEEVEVIADLFSKSIEETRSHYKEQERFISEIEKDQDILDFIEFKRNGYSIEQIANIYNNENPIAGLNDDQIVAWDLLKKDPDLTDKELEEEIEFLKSKGRFESRINKIQNSVVESRSSKIEEEKETIRQQELVEQQEYQKNINEMVGYINKVEDLNGVKLTDQMKKDAFGYMTEIDPNTGVTYIESDLQSKEKLFEAAIFMLYKEDLLRAVGSKAVSGKVSKLLENLHKNPEKSVGKQSKGLSKYDPDAVFRTLENA